MNSMEYFYGNIGSLMKYDSQNPTEFFLIQGRGGGKSLILEFDRRHSAYDAESRYKTSDTKIRSIG